MSTSQTAVDPLALSAVLERMLGDVPTFFRESWHKRPLHVPSADSSGTIQYSVDQFLADLVATQPVPYGAVKAKDGRRCDSFHQTSEGLRDAVADGSVCAIKLSRMWHGPIPESWMPMRDLFGILCRAVATVYMSPRRSEDVDLFLAGPDSCLGTHFDTTDVFTLQLFGERKWTVEEEFSLDGILDVGRDPSWYPTREIGFPGRTREITLRAGDALYVPAYTVHRVTGVSWSVSLSLGLRAFNEIRCRRASARKAAIEQLLEIPPVRRRTRIARRRARRGEARAHEAGSSAAAAGRRAGARVLDRACAPAADAGWARSGDRGGVGAGCVACRSLVAGAGQFLGSNWYGSSRTMTSFGTRWPPSTAAPGDTWSASR